MHYVKQFHINGVDTKQVACIELHGKPNAATEGYVGVLGIDMDSPLHEVYKCVAVNGSIYSWELLSSGMSVISSTITKDGVDRAEFPYDTLRTPAMYVVKVGDLILDREAYVYQIVSIHSTYCEAEYCDVQSFKGAPGKNAYEYAVDGGYAGTEADFIAELSYLSGLKANAQHQLDDKANIGEKISNETAAHVKSVPDTSAPYAKVLEVGSITRKCTNLIPRPYVFEANNQTIDGLDITVRDDGAIVLNGTVDTGDQFTAAWLPIGLWEGAKKSGSEVFPGSGRTFTISGAADGGGEYIYQLRFVGGNENNQRAFYLNNSDEHAVFSDMNYCTIHLMLYEGVTYNNVIFKPMLNSGSTPLPYEPYFEGLRSAAVSEVESVGVNLLAYPYKNTTKTVNGVTYTDNGDGSVSFSGTPTAYSDFSLYTMSRVAKGAYYLSLLGNYQNIDVYVVFLGSGDKTISEKNYRTSGIVNVSDYPETTRIVFSLKRRDNGVACSGTMRIMLNEGTTAQPYAPYVRHSLPIPAAVQALDGYGWGVSDTVYNYIDYEKRQFVKRVGKVVFDGSNDEGWAYNTTYHCMVSGLLESKGRGTILANTPITCVFSDSACHKIQIGSSSDPIEEYGFSSATEWMAHLAVTPLEVVYELAEPVVEPIAALLPADNYIGVEGGGTVTMVSEYGYDVPSKVIFYEGSNEVVGADTFVGNLAGTAARAEADAEGKQLASREWVLKQLAALVAQSEAANTP